MSNNPNSNNLEGLDAKQLLQLFASSAMANRATLNLLGAQNDAERLKDAQHAANPLLVAPEEGFEHSDIIAASRSARGFRRSGIFVPAEKTLIPAGTFKSQAAYDAFMNDPNIIAVESAPRKLAAGAGAMAAPMPATVRSTAILGGSTENATPEMLAAASRGELRSHPAMGAGIAAPLVPAAGMSSGAAEIERVKMERAIRTAPKDDGVPTLADEAARVAEQLEEQAKANPTNPAASGSTSEAVPKAAPLTPVPEPPKPEGK